ncbi:hypothetical protein Tco_0722597 [Tanacetum coccineum]
MFFKMKLVPARTLGTFEETSFQIIGKKLQQRDLKIKRLNLRDAMQGEIDIFKFLEKWDFSWVRRLRKVQFQEEEDVYDFENEDEI